MLVAEKIDKEAAGLLENTRCFKITSKDRATELELLNDIGKYDAVMVRTYVKITEKIIDRAKNLKLIVRAGSGLDNVDVEYARSKGIKVKNTPKSNYISVAEHVFALILSLQRNIIPADKYIRTESGWDRKKFTGTELNGKVLGLVGIGLIGSQVAYIAQAFGMEVIAYDPFVAAENMDKAGAAKKENLLDIAKESDIVSLHIPLLGATRAIISKEFINCMKSTAIIINASRGLVIDECALIDALKNRKIKGAALDVFEAEPPKNTKLLSLKNTVFTPHLGAMTEEADRRMCMDAAKEVISFFK